MRASASNRAPQTPTVDELNEARRRFQEYGPETSSTRVATELIDLALAGKTGITVAEALAVLLQTWSGVVALGGRRRWSSKEDRRVQLLQIHETLDVIALLPRDPSEEVSPPLAKVILLTGAPGTGKSTLSKMLGERIATLQHFDYGQLLLRRKEVEGSRLTYEQLREQSAAIISPEDVTSTDAWVISEISRIRTNSHILIDSHALTRESYGFRAVAFSRQQLEALRLDALVVLRCDPEELIARVARDPCGRRPLTVELAREIQILQEALALTYGVMCGCPVFMIDSTDVGVDEVANRTAKVLAQIGINA